MSLQAQQLTLRAWFVKSALEAGQNYVIEKFVDTKYGGNLLYYKKLEALYTLLMDKINSNLKKADTDQPK